MFEGERQFSDHSMRIRWLAVWIQ
uniref:Uncharacterized protein n=1 Tax=Anguilla anguilla TaxID=7936 RepID=A0A0E9PBT5_ANGAN